MDRYSPLAPAFVRVLVLPVGQIERKRFLGLLDALKQHASIVRLEDVGPHVGDGELLLSPKAFPQGSLLYNYTTSVPSEHHHQLSPYELFREPLLVIGVVDGLGEGAASGLEELGEASRYLREKHQRVVHRQLLVIEKHAERSATETAENAVRIAEAALTDAGPLRDAVLAVSARFLSELSTYARALQASPSISTPGQTARSLQRSASARDHEKLPPSGRSTPTQASEAGSPVDASGVRTPPYGRSSPATSFDQIASNAQNALPRSESRARARQGGRASSQDRVSVQGFGSMSQEKLKTRGKARVAIVTGYLYMMAGQWSEALKILVDGTHKARTLSDFLWHAKGMEGVVVCLLLHAWAGVEFQIPTICYPIADRVTSGHSQRFSISMPSDFRTAEAAQKAALHRLSNYLPDLIKQILNLYDSGEASLELPFLVVSEVTIRFCKLLLILQRNSELSQEALKQLLPKSNGDGGSTPSVPASATQRIPNSTIANMLADAQPTAEDNVPLPDQVAILAGVASVYTSLSMQRKRAAAMRDMLIRLTHALTQARKRGAAEVGIHPAATLSADNGADSLLAAMELSGGLHQMLEDVARSYGVPSLSAPTDAINALLADASGNDTLKHLVLSDLSAFCEASPDLQGLLRVNTALLRSSSSNGVAGEDTSGPGSLSQEEQIRLTSTISRSVGVSKHLGLPKLEATYWDPFLVRDVTFVPPDEDHAVVSHSSLKAGSAAPARQSATNPLLYDPNASRPGTANGNKPAPAMLVQGEVTKCIIKLQNPYEVPVEIASISLITEEPELFVSQQSITLGALRLQEVPLSVTANSTGDCKVTTCRIRISGCVEQDFHIFRKSWVAPDPQLIKKVGQEAGILPIDKPSPPAHEAVAATVVEAQPLLVLQSTSLMEEGLMLLDGESHEIDMVLKNESEISAVLADFASTSNSLTVAESNTGLIVPAGESKALKLRLRGRAGVSKVQATFLYGRCDDQNGEPSNLRVLSVPIDVTVNASLQLQNLDILPGDPTQGIADALTLSLDIGNAWPKSLDFECSTTHDSRHAVARSEAKAAGTLSPGQVQRKFLSLQRPSLPHNATLEMLRDALLASFTGSWTGDGRKGQIDFSKLRPSAETLEVLRSEPVELLLDIVDAQGQQQDARSTVKAGSFIIVRARISGNGPSAMPLVVNFQPRNQDHTADSGIEERRFAVAGPQHRVLAPLAAGNEAQVDFAMCPLLAGSLELDTTVRPAQMLREVKLEAEGWFVQRTLSLRVV